MQPTSRTSIQGLGWSEHGATGSTSTAVHELVGDMIALVLAPYEQVRSRGTVTVLYNVLRTEYVVQSVMYEYNMHRAYSV